MWYFSWILGVGLVASFAILNGMWYEMREGDRMADEAKNPGDEVQKSRARPIPRITLLRQAREHRRKNPAQAWASSDAKQIAMLFTRYLLSF